MVQRKNKPSFFARASLLIKRLWQFVSVDIWHVTEYKLHIHILKTLNLSVRCFLNEKLQEKASALTFSTILAIVPALAMLFAICKGFGFQHIIQSQLFDYFPAQRNALEYMLGFVDQYLDQMKGGVFVGIGLCFLLWTLISLLSNIEKAFNDIWQVQGGRSFYRNYRNANGDRLYLDVFDFAYFDGCIERIFFVYVNHAQFFGSIRFYEPFAALGLSISSIYTYRFVLYRYLYFYTQYKG